MATIFLIRHAQLYKTLCIEEEIGRLLIMPYVSDEEQKEIEESYGKPSGVVSGTFIESVAEGS